MTQNLNGYVPGLGEQSKGRSLKIQLALWTLVFLLTALYCHMHGRILEGDPLSWQGSLGYGVSRWFMWALLTPWVYRSLVAMFTSPGSPLKKGVRVIAELTLCCLLAVAGLALVVWLFSSNPPTGRRLAQWLLYEWPKGLGVYTAIAGFWQWQSKRQSQAITSPASMPEDLKTPDEQKEDKAATSSFSERFVVQTGKGTAILDAADILWVSAARNYLEIHTASRVYLLRQTMKRLESQLNPNFFARIHRSTIVAYSQIEEIRSRQSGGYEIQLKQGAILPMSKAYRDRLLANISQLDKAKGPPEDANRFT